MKAEIRQSVLDFLEVIATRFDNHVDRGSIFLPEGDDLTIQICWGLSRESISRTKCYIGDDAGKKRGSAGNVYLTKQQRVVHLRQEANGQWKSDDEEHFINFTPQRRVWPYKSFVLTPIFEVGLVESVEHLSLQGVMVFNSKEETIFDSEEAKEYLRFMSRRIAYLLRICSPCLSGSGVH